MSHTPEIETNREKIEQLLLMIQTAITEYDQAKKFFEQRANPRIKKLMLDKMQSQLEAIIKYVTEGSSKDFIKPYPNWLKENESLIKKWLNEPLVDNKTKAIINNALNPTNRKQTYEPPRSNQSNEAELIKIVKNAKTVTELINGISQYPYDIYGSQGDRLEKPVMINNMKALSTHPDNVKLINDQGAVPYLFTGSHITGQYGIRDKFIELVKLQYQKEMKANANKSQPPKPEQPSIAQIAIQELNQWFMLKNLAQQNRLSADKQFVELELNKIKHMKYSVAQEKAAVFDFLTKHEASSTLCWNLLKNLNNKGIHPEQPSPRGQPQAQPVPPHQPKQPKVNPQRSDSAPKPKNPPPEPEQLLIAQTAIYELYGWFMIQGTLEKERALADKNVVENQLIKISNLKYPAAQEKAAVFKFLMEHQDKSAACRNTLKRLSNRGLNPEQPSPREQPQAQRPMPPRSEQPNAGGQPRPASPPKPRNPQFGQQPQAQHSPQKPQRPNAGPSRPASPPKPRNPQFGQPQQPVPPPRPKPQPDRHAQPERAAQSDHVSLNKIINKTQEQIKAEYLALRKGPSEAGFQFKENVAHFAFTDKGKKCESQVNHIIKAFILLQNNSAYSLEEKTKIAHFYLKEIKKEMEKDPSVFNPVIHLCDNYIKQIEKGLDENKIRQDTSHPQFIDKMRQFKNQMLAEDSSAKPRMHQKNR